jgi:hypothetical protein
LPRCPEPSLGADVGRVVRQCLGAPGAAHSEPLIAAARAVRRGCDGVEARITPQAGRSVPDGSRVAGARPRALTQRQPDRGSWVAGARPRALTQRQPDRGSRSPVRRRRALTQRQPNRRWSRVAGATPRALTQPSARPPLVLGRRCGAAERLTQRQPRQPDRRSRLADATPPSGSHSVSQTVRRRRAGSVPSPRWARTSARSAPAARALLKSAA